ncbi:MAG: N-acetylmuramoyl-L-alanine amidase [Bacteroidales bacterium]|jgi:RHS repeat-associated protein
MQQQKNTYFFEEPHRVNKAQGCFLYVKVNHLGNVRVVLSDFRQWNDANNDNTYQSTENETVVQSWNDYYAFGMIMPGRNFSSNSYRFGFNGKEKDDELKGNGNSYDYGYRTYDPRICRFLSIDPLTKEYPWYTPYQFAGNKPIMAVDLDGLEEKPVNETVAVDPGHGIDGSTNPKVDPGAVNGTDYEKDIVLNIANSVNKYLKEWNTGTVMTRTGDLTTDKNQIDYRLDVANNNNANVFLSIHTNSVASGNPSGFLVCYDPNNQTNGTESKKLAENIVNKQSIMSIRGTGLQERPGELGVLRDFKGKAAALVEVGFISNANDVVLMKTNADEIGKQIATGVYKFLNNADPPAPKVEKSAGVITPTPAPIIQAPPALSRTFQ